MKPLIKFVIFSSLVFLVMLLPAQAAGIKKWVDENGVTHYGPYVPPQYRDREHDVLNKRGILIEHQERAKTPEEIERDKAEQALRNETAKLKEEQDARDRILLNLYRNEDDLVMARDGKLAQIDGQIRLKYAEIRRYKKRLSEFQTVAASAERGGKQLTKTHLSNLQSTQRSIEKSYATILGKEDEKLSTVEKYNFDLERFRHLRKHATRAPNADVIKKSDIPDLVETAVTCKKGAECARLWEIAQKYARKHATTAIDLIADRILVTAPPRELKDVSITVSRLDIMEGGDGERIFMDVQCANFTEGKEFCRGPLVSKIRTDFRTALERNSPD